MITKSPCRAFVQPLTFIALRGCKGLGMNALHASGYAWVLAATAVDAMIAHSSLSPFLMHVAWPWESRREECGASVVHVRLLLLCVRHM